MDKVVVKECTFYLSCYNCCRELFERATNLKLSAKKMKSVYKKYLSFESEHGSPASTEAVLDKARAFASSSSN